MKKDIMYCPDSIHKERIEMEACGRVDIGDDIAFDKWKCNTCGGSWLLILNYKE